MGRSVSNNFEAQRAAILASAVHAFASEGFACSSMNSIAERAGVSKALIYHYYPNKESLLFEAMLRYLTDLRQAVAQDTSPHALRGTLNHLLTHYRAARCEHVILMNEMRHLSDEQRDKITRLQKQVVQAMRTAITGVVPALADREVKAVTMLVLGMVNWIYTWYSDKGPVSHARLTELVDRMVEGAMQALAQEPEPAKVKS